MSQKRDLLTDCQWGLRTYGHTDGVTMRGEGLSCYVQLKNVFAFLDELDHLEAIEILMEN